MAEKKTTTQKSSSRKGSRGKKSASTSSAGGSGAKKATSGSRKSSAPRAEPSRKPTGRRVAEAASQELAELTSKQVEGVTGLERTDDGWRVEVEVLELRRVPSTTDVLATYEVLVDGDGDLESYRRRHRYVRGTPGEESS